MRDLFEEKEEEEKQEQQEQQQRKKKTDKTDEITQQTVETGIDASEYKEMLQRLQAEFENYKKRAAKELADSKERASAEIIAKILPVMDSFEIALKNTKSKERFAEGVRLIYSQLFTTLEGLGLKAIKAEGQRFNPYLHEALMVENVENRGLDNKVLEEFQKGYELKGAVIRHSKVKIGKFAEYREKKEIEETEAQNG